MKNKEMPEWLRILFNTACPDFMTSYIKGKEALAEYDRDLYFRGFIECYEILSKPENLAKFPEVRVLVEALEFYADRDNWDDDAYCPTIWDDGNIDLGRKAIKALEPFQGE